MKRVSRPLCLLGAVIVIACVGAVSRVLASAAAPPPPPDAVALTAAAVAVRSEVWPTYVHTAGPVAAREEIGIAAEVGQVRLVEVRVDVGDRVREGQLVARLDGTQLRLEAVELDAERVRAAAALRLARSTLARSRSLESGGAVSRQELERQEADADTARAEHDRVSARLALKRLQLARTRIVAPRAGVVSRRTALAGAIVASGEELFRVVRDHQLEWRAELTSSQLALVASGQGVQLQAPDGGAAAGSVRQVAPMVSTTSRLGLAVVDLAPGSALRAGMFTEGRIAIGDAAALVLPASSIVVRDGRPRVARLTGSGPTRRVDFVAVGTGRRQGRDVEVTDGLSVGDDVVREGAGLLGDGDRVRLAAGGMR